MLKRFRLEALLEQDFRLDAIKHAQAEIPREAVGLVVDGAYWPCKNIADAPRQHFVLDPHDYARAMFAGTIEAIVHSHPEGTPPSECDRKACKQSKLPWYVYSVPNDLWSTIYP